MADEDVKGTSADAEVPEANEIQADEAPAEEPKAEETADEPVAEGPADQPEASAEPEAAEAEAPSEDAATDAEVPGTSAEAEVPAKRKRKRVPRSQRRQRSKPARPASAERKPIVRLEKPEHERGRRQERQGKVVSDAMEKTIVVRVDVVKAHPRYKKVVRRSVKFHAHDETSQAKVGDVVRIVETRPLSKTKRWRLAEVVKAAK
jgi:small subunit ribosomal protein S17